MSAKKVTSDRKRSRPVHKKTIIDDFKKNKLAQALVVIIIVSMIVGAGLYYMANRPNPVAVINTSEGTIKVELYKDKVPNTVDNFIKLVEDGFYEDIIFHRVANLDSTAPETHIIQGGGFDAEGNQKESPYGSIDLEIDDSLSNVDGAVAMARTNETNSASSQFYICDGDNTFLDDSYRQANDMGRGYAVFGQVIQGMEVVREIANVTPLSDPKTLPNGQTMTNWPSENITILSVSIE